MFSKKNTCTALGAALIMAGCGASGPSSELVSARQAIADAKDKGAPKYAPSTLYDAQQALNKAEKAHEDEPQSTEEKHFAYLAQRRAQISVAQAELKRSAAQANQAEEKYLDLNEDARQESQAQLQKSKAQLQQERELRMKAEREAAAALMKLDSIANVKKESKQTVITLPGEVLFKTGKSDLRENAQAKLGQVAEALSQQAENATMIIVGHTDSRGSETYNLDLSKARAESVRSYMVTRGVDASKIEAIGKGETDPVASNDTPEGRANNRRVEIIVQANPKVSSANGSSGTNASAMSEDD